MLAKLLFLPLLPLLSTIIIGIIAINTGHVSSISRQDPLPPSPSLTTLLRYRAHDKIIVSVIFKSDWDAMILLLLTIDLVRFCRTLVACRWPSVGQAGSESSPNSRVLGRIVCCCFVLNSVCVCVVGLAEKKEYLRTTAAPTEATRTILRKTGAVSDLNVRVAWCYLGRPWRPQNTGASLRLYLN